MPPANIAQPTPPGRILIYGKGKSKKTWWVLDALRSGYVVILIDGDNGRHIIDAMDLTPEQLSRLFTVDATDTTDRSIFAPFAAQFSRSGHKFRWHEREKRAYIGHPQAGVSYIDIEAALLPRGIILCADSWTSLAQSTLFKYAIDNKLSLEDAQKLEWPGYGFEGRFLTHIVKFLKALPCHVVVVGHSTVHEKRNSDGKIVKSTIQLTSSSHNHASTMNAHFSDVLYFEKLSGTVVTIDAAGSGDLDAGCRFVKPGSYQWDKLTLASILDRTRIPKWEGLATEIPGFTWVPPKTEEEIAALAPPKNSLVSSLAAPAVPDATGGRLVLGAVPAKGSILSQLGQTKPTETA